MNGADLLRRAADFAGKAPTLDFGEDRCIMWAVHLAENIRAFLASADTHPKDGDVKQAPLVSGAVGSEASETPEHSPGSTPSPTGEL